MTGIRAKVAAALAKPTPADDDEIGEMDPKTGGSKFFSPWTDLIANIYGDYASESDALMISALIAVRDRDTLGFIKKRGFAGEFALYVLAGNGLTDYGTSPRGGWPVHEIEDLWQDMIDAWTAYYEVCWGEPYHPPGEAP
jgi:hypothetical protein